MDRLILERYEMKKYIIVTIFALSLFLTGCYTEIGYDYEREAYWDKV